MRAAAVGEAHLAAAFEIEARHELVDAVRVDVRVVHGKAPAERGRVEAVEVVLAFLDVVRKVVNFRLLRLGVEVLEQELRFFFSASFAALPMRATAASMRARLSPPKW